MSDVLLFSVLTPHDLWHERVPRDFQIFFKNLGARDFQNDTSSAPYLPLLGTGFVEFAPTTRNSFGVWDPPALPIVSTCTSRGAHFQTVSVFRKVSSV